MFRKLTLAAVTGLGLLAAAPAAKADGHYGPHHSYRHHGHYHHHHGHYHHHHHQRPYNVYYRTCPTAPWVIYQGYPIYQDAYRASFGLRTRGFEVFVR